MDKRKEKGYQIAQQKQIRAVKGGWLVKSQSREGFYKVNEAFICDCPDSELHNRGKMKVGIKDLIDRKVLDNSRETKEFIEGNEQPERLC